LQPNLEDEPASKIDGVALIHLEKATVPSLGCAVRNDEGKSREQSLPREIVERSKV
jgi:hypothetical protein